MSDDTDDELTLADALAFGKGEVEQEVEDADGDVPNHATALIISRADAVLQTATNIELHNEGPSDDIPEDKQAEMLESSAVDLLLSLCTLSYEHDLDIADAFETRKAFIEDYREFEKVRDDDDATQADVMEAFEKYMEPHMDEGVIGDAAPDPSDFGGIGSNVETGDNVDDDDYEHDGVGRGVQ